MYKIYIHSCKLGTSSAPRSTVANVSGKVATFPQSKIIRAQTRRWHTAGLVHGHQSGLSLPDNRSAGVCGRGAKPAEPRRLSGENTKVCRQKLQTHRCSRLVDQIKLAIKPEFPSPLLPVLHIPCLTAQRFALN